MTKYPSLSEEIKNNMAKLLSPDFITGVFDERLAEYYKDFKEVKSLELTLYKKHLGRTSTVIVAKYKINYLTPDDQTKMLQIFVSAHSDGSRARAFAKNKYLYDRGFDKGNLRVTRPLFYLSDQYAYFYHGSIGRRLLSFFRENPEADLQPVFSLVATWMKKLHAFAYADKNFQWPVFTIDKMVPEPQHFINDFYRHNQDLGDLGQKLYDNILAQEKSYDANIKKTLIYGDNHPENIIIDSLHTKHLEMIDFSDVAVGDPMVDLGSFLQQFDFMSQTVMSRSKINQYKIAFVETYFGQSLNDIDIDYINRINLYQSWTALRSSTFLFYMKDVQNEIGDLLADCRMYLNLAQDSQRTINLF